VPSLLDEPESGLASVVLVASPDGSENRRALAQLEAGAPAGVHVVVVADGVADTAVEGLATKSMAIEIVRTSARLGHGAALNIGIRRSRAPVVVVLDPSIMPTGDLISPMVDALADPNVAIAGPFGFVSSDLQRFDEVIAAEAAVDAVAINGLLMGFRRADAAARGPIDEAFRFYRNLDVWWSLVLRDEGEGTVPRRAVVVPALPLERGQPATLRDSSHQERLAKRNFYRVLDRFRTRLDLASG
jgi:GT2 family glycosyltransferase